MSASTHDLDHLAVAVADAADVMKQLREQLGARFFGGAQMADCRYAAAYIGDGSSGGCIEVLEPDVRDSLGFVGRFLRERGAGAHHVTFTVPDLRRTVDAVRDLGLAVVLENYANAAWKEAFIAPDGVHGIVIQIAQTDVPTPDWGAPSVADSAVAVPTVDGSQPWDWAAPVSGVMPVRTAVLGEVIFGSTDLEVSRRLFLDILRGSEADAGDGTFRADWSGGHLRISAAEKPGLQAVTASGLDMELVIGGLRILPGSPPCMYPGEPREGAKAC